MDVAAPISTYAPTVVEYFDPGLGEMFSSPTLSRWVERRPATPPVQKAESASTSKVIQIDASEAPEHVALQRLRRFKTFGANWDAERAPAPNHRAIDSAIVLLSLLSAHGLTPKVVLGSDGLPMLLLSSGSAKGEVIAKPDDTIDYYFDTPEGDGESDVAFDGRSIPASLLRHIQA